MRLARHRARKAVIGVLALVLTGLAVSGCGGRVGEGGRVGLVYMDAQGYYAGVRKGMLDSSRKLGEDVQILEINAQGDASKESRFVDTVSSAGVKALVMSPVSTTASIPAVKLAHDSGVKVICYNTCLTDEATRKYVSAWILGDPVKFGELAGAKAAEYFVSRRITAPRIGVINCETVEVCRQRRAGFEKALFARLPEARIVANQQGTTIDSAVQVAERVLTAHRGLDAFYGESGGATMGAVKAVRQRGLIGKTVVFGSDMTTDLARELVDNRILKADVDISGQGVGKLAAHTTAKVVGGEKLGSQIVAAPVELYSTPGQARKWLATHPDGLP
ncbi:sugar ABC transporter substrate-binding protein [Streptomyces sp. HC44]|uniref:Sugar ABC transporter substrate-binding protein n=1 Tax=Streptomyces scabichelini TaxID=2711217 RepID=A0A6G4V4E5_9ACTN|nr:substrate-binding domain-containing protein [Streptomyces scabichelini]NGO08952.1 sugar ABC transporter substrate-binding protein [Streptomyces scabichelini]